ncbi:primosomal protein N' [Paenibacillus sambharensis]|uniref:Replication restart protein PriA n=1 Tax=Paenibacillus sambharensis TaxID=1803190 RepID=A0A2W1LPA6_9BACL|nr:primosomal protein N' [Paenibacillus sambharensis]PZD93247.1 primosomal protein N' [Paenibacillus sambharensis]
MIARVIVDVPSRQTDRPFDYRVDSDMAGWIEVGSRVAVPFGGRTLQGFVVGFAEEAEVEKGRLKAVAELLDPMPPLLPDLIELARWMSITYVCTWTTALQAMIPAALKGKAERYVYITEDRGEYADSRTADQDGYERGSGQGQLSLGALSLPIELEQFIRQQEPVKLSLLQERYPQWSGLLKSALREGLLTETVSVRNRVAVKKVLTVFPPDDREAAEAAVADMPARAAKQREALAYMLEQEEPVPLQQLLAGAGLSASSVRALADKGLLRIEETQQDRDPYAGRAFVRTEPLPLTELQSAAFGQIAAAVRSEQQGTMLLQGVTGSGKTEVYLQAIEQCIMQGRQAIVLVPEIALTPQMVERFKGRFGDLVAVLHSRLSTGERYDEWRKIREKRVKVAIGARSAIFAPFERIGLIIIDEEHETSYKQEESPKYHARDVAVRRAEQHGAVVVLGSATPSLESYAAAVLAPGSRHSSGGEGVHAAYGGQRPDYSTQAVETGMLQRAVLLPLPERVGGRPMPGVEIVDMRAELQGGNRSMFSRKLHQGLADRLERGEQSVLLLNRRGYSTFVMCRSCGYTAGCPHCEISLTFHQKSRALRCHYCGHTERSPETCPSCGSEHIRFFGTGTQRVEEELAKLFPGIRVIRMDVDTTTEKGSHEKLLSRFGKRQADVLLGTQMVAKGLDFPYVTLVGVIAADTSLHLPDFRAAEKTFQLLTQVAGRAGRHELPGEVIIQTYTPEHYSVLTSQRHDYESFVREELKQRRILSYPPYCRLILVTLSHEQLPQLVSVSEKFAEELRVLAAEAGVLVSLDSREADAMEVLGPVASPIPRLKDRYRFQCMIKYRGAVDAAALVKQAARPHMEGSAAGKVLIGIDVDPQVIL